MVVTKKYGTPTPAKNKDGSQDPSAPARKEEVKHSPYKRVASLTPKPSPTAAAAATKSPDQAHMRVHVVALQTPEVLQLVTDKNGHGGYTHPVDQYTREKQNEHRVQVTCRIFRIVYHRKPDDPFSYLEDPPSKGGTYRPRHMVLVTVLQPDEMEKTTDANLTALAERLVHLWNSTDMQRRFGNNPGTKNPRHTLTFSGILSPPGNDISKRPVLSDFLTVGDTMDLIAELYRDETTNDRVPLEDLVLDDEIMSKYFKPELIPEVRNRYTGAFDEEAINFEKPLFA